MGMLTKEDSEAKKIQWNENPSVNDYLGITNHGKINDDVFPWKDIIIRIKGGDSSPLTNYQRLRLTKSYREIYKFIEYYHIKSYVSEEVLETYYSNIGRMLKEIEKMGNQIKIHDDDIYTLPFIILIIIFIISAILVFLNTNHFIIVVLYSIIAFPCILIVSYIISQWMKSKKKTSRQRDIELSYSRLLPKSVDDLIDEIYNKLIQSCKKQ